MLLSVFVGCLYALLAVAPEFWWIWASLLFSAISIFLAAIAPIVLMPIFFKFEPLPDGELKERLDAAFGPVEHVCAGCLYLEDWEIGR